MAKTNYSFEHLINKAFIRYEYIKRSEWKTALFCWYNQLKNAIDLLMEDIHIQKCSRESVSKKIL